MISGKLDVTGIRGKWESFVIQVVDNPHDGVEKGLVIAGSDMRLANMNPPENGIAACTFDAEGKVNI